MFVQTAFIHIRSRKFKLLKTFLHTLFNIHVHEAGKNKFKLRRVLRKHTIINEFIFYYLC